MTNLIPPLVIGSGIGLGIWFANLVSMENILQRPDSNGIQKPTPENIWEYVKLPFQPEKAETAWATNSELSSQNRIKMLSLNWVAMASLGALGTTLYWKCST